MSNSSHSQRFLTATSLIFVIALLPFPGHARHIERSHYQQANKYKHGISYNYGHKYRQSYHYSRRHRHSYYPVGYRIHSLPRGYVSFSFGGHPYYFHAGTYYRPYGAYYRVVRSPYFFSYPYGRYSSRHHHDDDYGAATDYSSEPGSGREVSRVSQGYAYPIAGQDADKVRQDQYECYLWASEQTGYDPAKIEKVNYSAKETDYQRARSACLEARGYSVK